MSRSAGIQWLLDGLSEWARADILTDLLGQHAFADDSNISSNNRPTALFLIDINNFKRFNHPDHHKGDFVIKEVASALGKIAAARNSKAYRVGGDEFVIVAVSDEDSAAIVELLGHNFSPFTVNYRDEGLLVTLSVGVSTVHSNEAHLSLARERAETALACAKLECAGAFTVKPYVHGMEAEIPTSARQRCRSCGVHVALELTAKHMAELPRELRCPYCSSPLTELFSQ